MRDVIIRKLNDIYVQVQCSQAIKKELYEYFSFYAKNYKHMPKYRDGLWDGKIRLFNYGDQTLYYGLAGKLVEYLKKEGYSFGIKSHPDFKKPPVTYNQVLDLPFKPYDYQLSTIERIFAKKRALVLSPTSSGKSLIIYMAVRQLLAEGKQIVIIVPTTSLVEQLYKDFKDYGWSDALKYCHKLYGGAKKISDKPVLISTWQSLYRQEKPFFDRFDAVFCDEAHLAQAVSIQGIMQKMPVCEYRIGLTGTIEDSKTHKLTLQGLFGKIHQTIKTHELMELGIVADLDIIGLQLDHNTHDCKIVSKMKYQDEIGFLVTHEKRNNLIKNLAIDLEGNTLILFQLVELHGIPLFQMIKKATKKKVFIVHGEISAQDREDVREYCEEHNDVIIVASYGTFSTGVSIKNLDNIILAHPFKSKIKILQSIGRSLRKATDDARATLFDVADNLLYSNTTFKHFKERLKLYANEKFNVEIQKVKL